ncbi:hypothetical protein AV521_00580 [Streptomyces sp. IMTB 2501]|uniref:hypothetical protein n=1 Tax=Streptomyces sp. IMTB 2501 TaxID=1776340 RepID=UPI00096D0816|nr:hypothetical protein [Streptomyces sp. IMTB 2501]OLZ74228.1 hypothetical protein AV521_00580 [Streptomyces sp. IMTB 2501]
MSSVEHIRFKLDDGSRESLHSAVAAARRNCTADQEADGLWDAWKALETADPDGSFVLTGRELYWVGKASRVEFWRDAQTMQRVMGLIQQQFNAWSMGADK